MTPEIPIAPELIGEWEKYINDVGNHNRERHRRYAEELDKIRSSQEDRIREQEKSVERARSAWQEADRLVNDCAREVKETTWSFRIPWWGDDFATEVPETLLNKRDKAWRRYLYALESLQRSELSSLYSELAQPNPPARPQYEEKTLEAFLSWMVDKKEFKAGQE